MSKTTKARVLLHLDEVLASPAFLTHPRCTSLLRYLVEQSLAGKRPREIDIAVDVFGKNDAYDPAENSSVRVSVHQLRKMLRDYYTQPSASGDIRLSIPKGSYRVSFGVPLAAEEHVAATDGRRPRLLAGGRVGVGAAVLALSLAANLILLSQQREADVAERTIAPPSRLLALSDLAEGAEPILIVLGDFFFFQEEGVSEPGLPQFTRRVDINSADDLRRFAGDDYGVTVVPSQRSYLPKVAAFALETIVPFAKATGKSVSMKLMSDVSGEDLRNNDVIYVGYLRSMGLLRDYVFRSSNFCAEPPFIELLHKDTGDTFARSGYPFEHVLDYGLFAGMAGPGGARLLLFTGISDVGILHTVRALTDPTMASEVERVVANSLDGIPPEVEILFEVSGYDRAALVGTKITAFERVASSDSERELVDAGAGASPVAESFRSPCESTARAGAL